MKKTAIHFAMLGAIYIGHSSMRHVHNLMKSQLYTYLGSEGGLVLPLSVAEFNGLWMQFEEKQLCTLVAWYGLQTLCQTSERMLNPAFIDYRVQQGLYTILGKSSYTVIRFTKHAFVILCTIPGKNSYTLSACENRPLRFYIL